MTTDCTERKAEENIHLSLLMPPQQEQAVAQWYSAGLVIGRSRVQSPTGEARKMSSPES